MAWVRNVPLGSHVWALQKRGLARGASHWGWPHSTQCALYPTCLWFSVLPQSVRAAAAQALLDSMDSPSRTTAQRLASGHGILSRRLSVLTLCTVLLWEDTPCLHIVAQAELTSSSSYSSSLKGRERTVSMWGEHIHTGLGVGARGRRWYYHQVSSYTPVWSWLEKSTHLCMLSSIYILHTDREPHNSVTTCDQFVTLVSSFFFFPLKLRSPTEYDKIYFIPTVNLKGLGWEYTSTCSCLLKNYSKHFTVLQHKWIRKFPIV